MKKILCLFAIVCLGKLASAQSTDSTNRATHDSTATTSSSKGMDDTNKDAYITVQGGNVMEVKNNKVEKLEKDKTLKDGTVIMIDGTVKSPDGTTRKLKEGERVYADGRSGNR